MTVQDVVQAGHPGGLRLDYVLNRHPHHTRGVLAPGRCVAATAYRSHLVKADKAAVTSP